MTTKKLIAISADHDGEPLITAKMKAQCIGEFWEEINIDCPECYHEPTPNNECSLCGGEGFYTQPINITWTNTKEIYKKMVLAARIGELSVGDHAFTLTAFNTDTTKEPV